MQQALRAYIDEILKSDQYLEYVRQKEKVKQFPELKKQIDEFRARNFEMQIGKDMVFEKIEAFEKEYEDFRENPLVSDFLAAELALCRMLQKHGNMIMNEIDFE